MPCCWMLAPAANLVCRTTLWSETGIAEAREAGELIGLAAIVLCRRFNAKDNVADASVRVPSHEAVDVSSGVEVAGCKPGNQGYERRCATSSRRLNAPKKIFPILRATPRL